MQKLFLFSLLMISACKSEKKDETAALIAEADKLLDSVNLERKADSMTKAIIRSTYFDTLGISLAPVKVLSYRIVKNEYSSFRDIALSWKNISDKKISAIKFKWYGVDAFNEPADMGSGFDGLGGGMADRTLRPGKSDNGEWSMMSRNAKKVLCAWPYEVAFEDGTFWKQTP